MAFVEIRAQHKEGAAVKFIRSRLQFARTKIEGPAKASVETTMVEILPAIEVTMKSARMFPLRDVVTIVDILDKSIATEDAKKAIMDAVYAKANVSGSDTGCEKKKQAMRFPENYQSEESSAVYTMPGATVYERLFAAAVRCRALDCINLDEPSKANVAAIALSKDGINDPETALQHTVTNVSLH